MSPSTDRPQRYGAIAVVLHWLLAAALIGQLALGWWMLELPKSPPGLRAGWFNVHKSIGLTNAAVAHERLGWRLAHPVPPSHRLSRWQQRASRATHLLMDACMLALPLSGYLGSAFSGYPVLFFGLRLPDWAASWPAAKQALSQVHEALALLFVTLVALHVAAALWHWMRRDGIAARMGLPETRRRHA